MASSVEASSAVKSWELSLYELHRVPHEAITDQTVQFLLLMQSNQWNPHY